MSTAWYVGSWASFILLVACSDGVTPPAPAEPTPEGPPKAGVGDLPCEPGEVLLPDGGCRPAGVPPADCGEWLMPLDGGCQAIVPDSPCASGMMVLPGETACHVVASCGGEPWSGIPVDADTQFVDGSHSGASDGSQQLPWTTIDAALAAATAGAVVAVAAGDYPAPITVDDGVQLWGTCPGDVEISGAVVVADGSIHHVAIAGHGVSVSGGEAMLDGVWIHDTTEPGIDVAVASSASINDSLIERATGSGILAAGSLQLVRSEIRGIAVNDEGGAGRGVGVISADGSLVSATIARVYVHDVHSSGVYLRSADATVTDTVVHDVLSSAKTEQAAAFVPYGEPQLPTTATLQRVVADRYDSHGLYAVDAHTVCTACSFGSGDVSDGLGAGVFVASTAPAIYRASLTLDRGRIAKAPNVGGTILSADGYFEGVIVSGTEPTAVTGMGRGIELGAISDNVAGSLTLHGVIVSDVVGAGIAVVAGTLDATSVGVHDVASDSSGQFGYGISAFSDAGTDLTSYLVLEGVRIERCGRVGLVVLGSADVRNTTVRDILSPTGSQTAGIVIQGINDVGFVTSSARIEDSLVEGTQGLGVIVTAADAELSGVVIRDVTAHPSDGTGGDCIAATAAQSEGTIVAATVSVAGVVIDSCDRVGILNNASDVTLSSTWIECARIPLDGESWQGEGYTFANEGGNTCECDGEESTCKIVSTSIAPPDPL